MDKLPDSVVDTSSLESAEFTEYKKTLPQEPSGDVKKILQNLFSDFNCY